MALFASLWHDTRQSLRSLAREPRFTGTALLILALCVGANVAIFAVVHDVLLKPLPFREPERLVSVYNRYPKAGVDRAGVSVPHYLERQKEIDGFAATAAMRYSGVTVGEAGSPDRVDAGFVTPSFFSTLQVGAALGRTFTDEEGNYGKNQVVVLSDGLWRQRFGADPRVIGRTLRVDTNTYTIVGVMAPGFRYLTHSPQLWTPLCFSDEDRGADHRHSNNMEMIARLKPGLSLAGAQAQIDGLNQRTLETDPYGKIVVDAGFTTAVRDLREDNVARLRPVLILLQAGVGFLLLIGAVNLANLLLVRASGRAKEYSVRQALGASGVQVARGLVVESVVLSLAGGVLGITLGAGAVRVLAVLAGDQLPVSIGGLAPAVAAAALAISAVLGVVLALPVLWHALHGNLTQTLAVESRGGTTTRAVHRLRHTLIVAQIALAFVLLAGTGLLGLSFERVLAVNPGFRPENVLTGAVDLPWSHYKEPGPRVTLVDQLLEGVRSLPGVTSVGITTGAPFTGSLDNNAISIEGRPLAPGESLQAHTTSGIAGDYLQALGVPLLQGRYLSSDDSHAKLRACVVDEVVAKRYWPAGDAIGHRLINGAPDDKSEPFTIVGVVGAVKQNDLADREAHGAVYFPYRDYAGLSFMITLRTRQAPESAASMVRAAVLKIDPELPLNDVKSMNARVDDSLASRRLPLLLAGVFAGVAQVLAAVGIYGVLAYTVAQRRREIGVRMAVGARPDQILRQFLTLGARLLAVALPLGFVGAWLAGRAMKGMLFGVGAADPLVLGATAAVLALVALFACLLPSRRAARVAPIEALRG